jgi:serine protease 16
MIPFFSLFLLRWTMRLPSLAGTIQLFNQTLDHFNTSSLLTFPQRYILNTDFCNVPSVSSCDINSTIILYISGEAPMSSSRVSTGPLVDLSNRTHSLLASLEHRFYGESIPLDLTTDSLTRFLTTEQALADLSSFIDFLKKGNSSRSVIVVGGSYAGTLSSYFRQTYPNHANISWSSSPPLLLKLNFTEYDFHCAEVLKNQTDYPRCYSNSLGLIQWFDRAITNETEFQTARSRMRLNRSIDSISMLSMVADQLAGMIQYRSRDGGRQLTEYCQNQSGLSFDIDSFFDWFAADNPDPDSNDQLLLTNVSRFAADADSRAWTWQTCNEYGWFQTASGELRSSYLNLSYYVRVCNVLFNGTGLPNQAELARRFGGLNPRTSNIVFVNGAVDPWSTLSIENEENITEHRKWSVRIYSGSHCSELSVVPGEPEETTKKREFVLDLIEGLLKNGTQCIENCGGGGHGHCELGKCLCDPMWGGETCDEKQIDVLIFQISAGAMVGLPAIMMVVIGCSAWVLFRAETEEGVESIPL